MKKIKGIILISLLISLFILPQAASASEISGDTTGDRVVLGGSFDLAAGERLGGNLIVIGGVISLEEGSFVNGDVILIGGNARISGEINQSLVVIGGVVEVDGTAVIHQDLVAPGALLTLETGAVVEGETITQGFNWNFDLPLFEPQVEPNLPGLPLGVGGNWVNRVVSLIWFGFQTLIIASLALLAVVLIPAPIEASRNKFVEQPLIAVGAGFAGFMISGFVALLLAITILLSPIAVLILIFMFVMLFFGWIVFGFEVGNRLRQATGRDWSPAIQAGLGTLIMWFAFSSLNLINLDLMSTALKFITAIWGLGGFVLIRFGKKETIQGASAEESLPMEENSSKNI